MVLYNNYYYALDPARGDSPSLDLRLVVGVPVAAVAVILIITVVVSIILCVLIKHGKFLSILAKYYSG